MDDVGDHVFAGTPSGVYETTDAAKTWTQVTAAAHWGSVNSFRNGTINGVPTLFIGASGGLGNVPISKNKSMLNSKWNLIPSPPGSAAWRTNMASALGRYA